MTDGSLTPPEPLPVVPVRAPQPPALDLDSYGPPQVAPPTAYAPPVQYAPPGHYAPPGQFAAPPPQPRKPMRMRIVVAITAGVVLVLTLLVGLGAAVVGVATTAVESLGETIGSDPAGPLVEGDEASPHAVEPPDCADPCFDKDVATDTIPDQYEFDELGVPSVIDAYGDYTYTTATLEYGYALDYFTDSNVSPNSCFFTYISVPLVGDVDTRVRERDRIDYTGTHGSDDGYSTLGQSVRFFETTASATAHMEQLQDAVAGCPGYTDGGPDKYSITPAPQLEVPDSMAAYGWRESSPYYRYYVFDVQHGNVVVRSTLATDGSVSEQRFRNFVVNEADLMKSFQPVDI